MPKLIKIICRIYWNPTLQVIISKISPNSNKMMVNTKIIYQSNITANQSYF